jgi:hypothetical protein
MKVEISIGELIDKWTILKIKSERISDQSKLINIKKEIEYLYNEVLKIKGLINDDLSENLLKVNQMLWQVEDDLRVFESNNIFNESFVSSARSVYKLNDLRASIKMKINLKYNSNFVEEKSHI